MTPLSSIFEISPYVGGDVTPKGMIRRVVLASNESPFGPPPAVEDFLKNAASINIASYPSGGASKLRNAIAEVHKLKADHIICGNGSEEIIHMLVRTLTQEGDEVVMPRYGFLVYRIATLSCAGKPIFYNQDDLTHRVESILKAVTPKTKIVFIDNPANPLGCMMSKEDILQLRHQIPKNILLVLDEAYAEFVDDPAYESGLTLFQNAANVMVLRTFSKIYGLAGLRIGYGYTANEVILDAVNRIRAPFNVNAFGQAAASIAIQDLEWVKSLRQKNNELRALTAEKIESLGYKTCKAYGNFILFHVGTKEKAEAIYRFLGERGVMIRPVAGYGLHEYLRVSIGKPEEMAEFITLLGDFNASY